VADLSDRLFDYPSDPHFHRHGPSGYKNYEGYKLWLRDEFTFTCAYCLIRERWQRGGHRHFSIEHVIPQTMDPSRITEYSNLIYSCLDCNSLRQDRPILNPFLEAFADHMQIADDGTIRGLTPEGIAHIKVLRLDDPDITEYRRQILQIIRLIEQSTDRDALSLLRDWIGFPHDLPNLAVKRPPGGNTFPSAAEDCYYQQRLKGSLPDYY
jgi:hypothetical protein